MAQSEDTVTNLELAIYQDVSHTFELYKFSMQTAAEQSLRPQVRQLDPLSRQEVLFKQLGRMLILDVNGNVEFDSTSVAPRPGNFAAREFFKVHQIRDDVGFYISKPFLGATRDKWLIALSQRISNRDGGFAGVVVATIEVGYFQTLFDKLTIGKHGTVFLLRDDGVLLSRTSESIAVIGDNIRDGLIFQNILKSPTGFFTAASPHYGSWKSYTHSKVDGFPIYLSVAIDITDLYNAWFRKLFVTAGVVSILTIAVTVLTLLWRKREHDLQIQFQRFKTALNKMPQGVCMFDSRQQLVVCNDRYRELYGLNEKQLRVGTALGDLIKNRTKLLFFNEKSASDYIADRLSSMMGKAGEMRTYKYAGGQIIAVSSELMEDGGWVSAHEDVTERTLFEEQITHLANHDPLTDLPNRLLLLNTTEKMLSRELPSKGVAVLYLDLDGFKSINDSFGHLIGDRLLKVVADRLRASVRDGDVVARLGGDEFAISITAGDPEQAAAVLARRILQSFSESAIIDGHTCLLAVSIGISIAPKDGHDVDSLFKCADLALYQAKNEGRARFRFFAPEINARLIAKRELEEDLRTAIERNELELNFQPIVHIETRQVTCFEALLRWKHPARGTVSPVEFIPIAEESGLIKEIGRWVLQQACEAAVTWPPQVRVAVNLSTVQFRDDSLAAQIEQICVQTGLTPRRLELEITESVLVRDAAGVLATLKKLRAIGMRIALDDFGTGYSSLSYLRTFPFDKLKIDREFVAELALSEDSHAIVRAIVGLGKSLGLQVTAEGVENQEQLRVLSAEGCSEAQGYLFARPMPASAIDDFLKSQGSAHRTAA